MGPDAQLPPGRGRQQQDISGGRRSKRKITRRWTDLATNEPDADHLAADYWAAICRAVELEEVDA